MLAILGWALFGLIVGAIARLLYPGPQAIGLLGTMLLGIAGSFLGGGVAYLFVGNEYHPAGWIMSIVGALAVVWISEMISTRVGRRSPRI